MYRYSRTGAKEKQTLGYTIDSGYTVIQVQHESKIFGILIN